MAIIVKGLVTKKGNHYWQPNAPERAAGWKPLGFGKDLAAAVKGCEERNAEIAAWRTGGAQPVAVRKFVARATVDHVIDRFKAEYYPCAKGGKPLAKSTQALYTHNLVKLSAWAGSDPIAAVTPQRVKKLREAMMTPIPCTACADCTALPRPRPCQTPIVRHTMAFNVLTTGRSLGAFAKSAGLIDANPFDNHGLGAPPPREEIWLQPAREAFIAAAALPVTIRSAAGVDEYPPETSIGLAFMLGFAICQREADVLKLAQAAYRPIPREKLLAEDWAILSQPALSPDGVVMGIRVRQGKTKRWVEVPIVGELRAAVEANIKRARAAGLTTILLDDRIGQPWLGRAGQQRFQERFAKVRQRAADAAIEAGDIELAAELRTLEFRDLRRTGVVYYAEFGLSDQGIAAITGHDLDRTREILETYMPRTTAMAAGVVSFVAARNLRLAAEQQEQSA